MGLESRLFVQSFGLRDHFDVLTMLLDSQPGYLNYLLIYLVCPRVKSVGRSDNVDCSSRCLYFQSDYVSMSYVWKVCHSCLKIYSRVIV